MGKLGWCLLASIAAVIATYLVLRLFHVCGLRYMARRTRQQFLHLNRTIDWEQVIRNPDAGVLLVNTSREVHPGCIFWWIDASSQSQAEIDVVDKWISGNTRLVINAPARLGSKNDVVRVFPLINVVEVCIQMPVYESELGTAKRE